MVGTRVGLVGCVKQKGTSCAPAKDLYTSALFRGRRRWVEQSCGRWFILSAKHGLVASDGLLDPYDESLTTASRSAKRAWTERVLRQLNAELGTLAAREFEIHAGADYRDWGLVDGLVAAGASVTIPAAGLRQGEQLALYARGPSSGHR
ncbi:MAG: hypothetical protein JWO77_3726 [Ilumatobacteraceae bacterium]|nr:hypothetical protein [Ilumatobacteraceae bacterium]